MLKSTAALARGSICHERLGSGAASLDEIELTEATVGFRAFDPWDSFHHSC